MHSLLITDNLHHGRFVQHGLKFEGLSTQLLSIYENIDSVSLSAGSFDSVLILTHQREVLDKFLDYFQPYSQIFPVLVLAQYYEPVLDVYLKSQKIHKYFTRPFPFHAIAMELRNMLYHQNENSGFEILKVRDLELHHDTHEVFLKGQLIDLRNKEFVLLEFFMHNPGKLLTREAILESVWDRNANIFTNTVDVHINKLRKKIDYNICEKFIHTIHCSGYIFS